MNGTTETTIPIDAINVTYSIPPDVAKGSLWGSDNFVAAAGQIGSVIVLSHLLKLVLKPTGLATPTSQILAGFVLGPSALSRFKVVEKYVITLNSTQLYFEPLAMLCRLVLLFLIGLEIDIPYLKRDFRQATYYAIGGSIMCSIFAGAVCVVVYTYKYSYYINLHDFGEVAVYIMMSIASAGTPLVVCIAGELKIANSDIGRLAIYCAVINDTLCMIVLDITQLGKNLGVGLLGAVMVIGVIFLNKFAASWLNKRNMDQKYLKNAHFLCLLAITVLAADFMESNGYFAQISCLSMGVFFPRGGKTTRTMLHRLNSYVHIFILPVYLGYVGFRADITQFIDVESWIILTLVVLSIIGGKICGTIAACRFLKVPLAQVAILPFLLSLKVHLSMLKHLSTQSDQFFDRIEAMVVVINLVIVAPVTAFIVRTDKSLTYTPVALELQNPENELRVLACVHAPRHVSTMVWLVGASSTLKRKPTVPYMIHLVELPKKSKNKDNLTYHQLDEDELSDDEDYGGDDVVLVNDALDAFVAQTGIIFRQLKVVAPYPTMYEEVCGGAEDMRASIVLLPFHKHQRIDGRMESDNVGMRTTNQRVLRHAPCTVAILIDRGLAGAPQAMPDPDSIHVATLFFGGADDREGLAYSVRICSHPQVNLTVIRFLPRSLARRNEAIENGEIGVGGEMGADTLEDEEDIIKRGADDIAISVFYNRFVTTGQAGYVEKFVENGAQTASALREMGDMYALFIVGKGGRSHLRITTEMSDWEECPELGTVGDLLASSDFEISGSVLVIQQRGHWADVSKHGH